MVGCALFLLQEGSCLLPWLLGERAASASFALRALLWASAFMTAGRRLLISATPRAPWLLLAAFWLWLVAVWLFHGNSVRYTLSETTFVAVAILSMRVSEYRSGRNALVMLVNLLVVVNLWLTFYPPAGYVASRVQVPVIQGSYGAIYLQDVERGSTFTGLYLYPGFSGALSVAGICLFLAWHRYFVLKWLMVFGCLLSCVLSFQRAVYVSMAITFLMLLRARTGPDDRKDSLISPSAKSVLLLLVAAFCVSLVIRQDERWIVEHRLSADSLTKVSRQRLTSVRGWLPGLEAAVASPLVGGGLPNNMHIRGPGGSWLGPHNTVIYAAAQNGIPFAVLYCAILWLALRGLAGKVSDRGQDVGNVQRRSLAAATVGCLTVWFFNPGYGPLFFWALLGIGLALAGQRMSSRVVAGQSSSEPYWVSREANA
jgi:hypothetical protein